ncbi:hypothetical protein GINT2_000898 [Glugoides intestinalis]
MANHVFLVKNTETDTLMHISKFSSLDDIFSTFSILKDDKGYLIKTGVDYICQDSANTVKPCKKKEHWQINKKTFGFTISIENMCLTAATKFKISLEKCTGSSYQLFDFKISDGPVFANSRKYEMPREFVLKIVKNELPDVQSNKKVLTQNPVQRPPVFTKKDEKTPFMFKAIAE